MQKTSSININLAKHRGESFVDRFIRFALTTGRIVVILTEVIALGAFLYRFTLDRTLVDLHDRIQQGQAVVNLLKDNETTFRNLQNRLSLAATLTKEGDTMPKYLTDVISYAPSDMQIHTIAVAPDAIRIEATLQSIDSLSTFVDKLKAYPAVTSVSLDRIANQTETATITVDITALLKQQPGVQTQQGAGQ